MPSSEESVETQNPPPPGPACTGRRSPAQRCWRLPLGPFPLWWPFLGQSTHPKSSRVQARPATSPGLRVSLSFQLPTTLLQIKDIRLDLQFVARPRVSRLNVTRAFFFWIVVLLPSYCLRQILEAEKINSAIALGGAPG